jgi:general secretion pathway protein G
MEKPKVESIILPLNSTENRTTSNSGFTFLELLIAMVIVAVLASLAFGSFAKFKELARVARCCEEIRSLEREIAAYATEKGELPPDLIAINRQDLKDPWGHPYHYHPAVLPVDPANFGPNNRLDTVGPINTDFDLYSLGSESTYDQSVNADVSKDDVIRASDGSFVGQPKDLALP